MASDRFRSAPSRTAPVRTDGAADPGDDADIGRHRWFLFAQLVGCFPRNLLHLRHSGLFATRAGAEKLGLKTRGSRLFSADPGLAFRGKGLIAKP